MHNPKDLASTFYRPLLLCLVTIGICLLGTGTSSANKEDNLSSKPSQFARAKLNPVLPEGWRKTTRGWERFPLTIAGPSIGQWMARQKREEANNPIVRPLQLTGQISPLSLAAAEIAVICLIALIAVKRRETLGIGPVKLPEGSVVVETV